MEATKTLKHILKCIPRTLGMHRVIGNSQTLLLSNGVKYMLDSIKGSHWILLLLEGEPADAALKHSNKNQSPVTMFRIQDGKTKAETNMSLLALDEDGEPVKVLWRKTFFDREIAWPAGVWEFFLVATTDDVEHITDSKYLVALLPSEME